MNARPSTPRARSDRGIQLYVAAFSCALYLVLLIAPVVGGALTTQFGLSPTQLGLLFSLELGAFSLATVPAYLWLRRVDLRTATYLFAAAVIGGNVVSGLLDSYPALVVVRFVTALAAGSITVIVLSLSGRTQNQGRTFGIFVACQLIMGAVSLAVFPVLFAGAPVAAVYWTLAGLTALCLPVAHLIDGAALRTVLPTRTGAPRVRPQAFLLGLAAVLLFYMSLSGVWTFMEAIGTTSGVARSTTAFVLSVATFAGIAPAVVASFFGDTPRRTMFLACGYTAMAVSVALLLGAPGVLRFAAAAVVFKFAWTFILPYLLSVLSDLSSGGQVMNTTNLMIGTGFAIGPVLGGLLIESSGGGFGAMLTVSLVGVVASGVCVLAARPAATPERTSVPATT